MTTNTKDWMLTQFGPELLKIIEAQGIRTDEDSIGDDVANLLSIGDLTAQFAYSLGCLTVCIHEISAWHPKCGHPGCGTCNALYAATSLIHAFDIVNGTAMWVNGGAREHAH